MWVRRGSDWGNPGSTGKISLSVATSSLSLNQSQDVLEVLRALAASIYTSPCADEMRAAAVAGQPARTTSSGSSVSPAGIFIKRTPSSPTLNINSNVHVFGESIEAASESK